MEMRGSTLTLILLQGLVIGFSIAAPIGPIGILCIQRTVLKGRAYGLVSGLGAATADAIYGSIAGFGLTVVSGALITQQFWLRLVGGAFLACIGIRTLTSSPGSKAAKASTGGMLRDYGSTFLLTITNPMTILFFAAVFVGLGLGSANGNYGNATLFVAGIFSGSALWWVILSSFVGFFRSRFNSKSLRILNVLSGLVILAFAAYFLLSIL